jgi:adenylosuccinate lyase
MSEAVMLALAKKGLGRQKAHELVREMAIKSHNEERPFKDVLAENSTVTKLLSQEEIENVMNPENYLGTAPKQVELVIQKTLKERKARGLND